MGCRGAIAPSACLEKGRQDGKGGRGLNVLGQPDPEVSKGVGRVPAKYRFDTEDLISGEGQWVSVIQHRTGGGEFMGESGCVCQEQCLSGRVCMRVQMCEFTGFSLYLCVHRGKRVVLGEFIGLCLSVQVSIGVCFRVCSTM